MLTYKERRLAYQKANIEQIQHRNQQLLDSYMQTNIYIWNLFHVLAEKVMEEHFDLLKSTFIDVVQFSCNNLSCSTCKNHANAYLKENNMNSIMNKEELKIYLWKFHNSVNIRKGGSEYPYDDLIPRYSAMTVKDCFDKYATNFLNFKKDVEHVNLMKRWFSMYCDQYFLP